MLLLTPSPNGRPPPGQTGQISSSRECQGFANPESESLNLEPAFDFHENSRCKIAEGAKHSYRRYFSHDKSRRFGAGKKDSNDKELITFLTDAVAMALRYNHEVNHSRRLAIKRGMHKDYAALCNLSTVDGTSEYLFGDLSKLAKDITEANKLRKKVRPQHSGTSRGDKYAGRSTYGSSQRRFQPYSRGKSSDFLGKSRFSKPPRKKKDGETSQRQ